MSIGDNQIIRELSRYLHQHPAEKQALTPVYDAFRDHKLSGSCRHSQRCPVVTTGSLVVDEHGRLLCLRYAGSYGLVEGQPEEQDAFLNEAALRLLAEQVGVLDVWTERLDDGPFVIDATAPGRHRYGSRLRIGVRYLFRAHSGAVSPQAIETGKAAWIPLSRIDIPPLCDRLRSHLIGTP